MAFEFLNSIGPLVNILSAVNGYRNANNAVSGNNVATASEKKSQALYAALADPNSPLLKQLTDQQQEQNLSDFQQQLTEMQLADRRAQAMGRSPTFFNPERADESLSYLTSRGLPQLRQQSQNQALARIQAAAGGIGGAMGAQQNRQQINMQQGVSNAVTNSGIPAQIIAALQGLDPNKAQNPMMGYAQPQYTQMRY